MNDVHHYDLNLMILCTFFTPSNLLQISSRLIITNSAMNFIIYGVMNTTFRRGYIDFLR